MAADSYDLFDRLFRAREAVQSLHWNYESVNRGEWYSVHKLTDDVLAALDAHIDVVGESLLATTLNSLLTSLPSGSKGDPQVVHKVEDASEKLYDAIKSARSFLGSSEMSIATRVAVEDMIKDLEIKHWLLTAGLGHYQR